MKMLLILATLVVSTMSFATVEFSVPKVSDADNSIEFFSERTYMGDIGADGYYVNLVKFESKGDPHVWYYFEVTSLYPDDTCTFGLYDSRISNHSAYVTKVTKKNANTYEVEYSVVHGSENYKNEYTFDLDTENCNHNILGVDLNTP